MAFSDSYKINDCEINIFPINKDWMFSMKTILKVIKRISYLSAQDIDIWKNNKITGIEDHATWEIEIKPVSNNWKFWWDDFWGLDVIEFKILSKNPNIWPRIFWYVQPMYWRNVFMILLINWYHI